MQTTVSTDHEYPEGVDGIWERVYDLAQKSPCNKRKVGCLIINEKGEFMSAGWNHNFGAPCENGEDTAETVIHAEDMAVDEIPDGYHGRLYAYVSHQPCNDCMSILKSACTDVYVHEMSPKWPNGGEPLREPAYAENDIKIEEISDPVNPKHYSDISWYKNAAKNQDAFNGFLHLNAAKYIERLHFKDGALQDARKAKWYLDMLIEELS